MLATTSLAASLRVLLRSSKRPRTNGANPTVTFLAKRRGAFIGGLRYGDGTLFTKDAGDLQVLRRGPRIGVDLGADGARTMMLVYNLPRTNAIYQQFNGIAGAAYFIAGLGMTTLTSGDEHMVVAPIRSGLGLRLGYNVGYLKFTSAPSWNPF